MRRRSLLVAAIAALLAIVAWWSQSGRDAAPSSGDDRVAQARVQPWFYRVTRPGEHAGSENAGGTATSSGIRGVVVDAVTSLPVKAEVRLLTGAEPSAVTDSDEFGRFEFAEAPSGTNGIAAKAPGYALSVLTGIDPAIVHEVRLLLDRPVELQGARARTRFARARPRQCGR